MKHDLHAARNQAERTTLAASFWWISLAAKIGTAGFIFLAAVTPSDAGAVSDYLCKRYCSRLDPMLDEFDEWVRDYVARRRGQVYYVTPLTVAGRGAECGYLPGNTTPTCCPDAQTRLLVEYSGPRHPYATKVRYKAVCVR